MFLGLYDDGKEGNGIQEFFRHVTKRWAFEVQEALYEDQRKGNGGKSSPRRAIVRAYLPGHEDCHKKYEPFNHSKISNGTRCG